MNKCILKGNVGEAPRITKFEDGGKVAQFSLATTERGFTTKDGKEVESRTTWHSVVVRKSGLAGVVEQFVQKGTPLLVIGRYESRKYTDKNGAEHTIYEVNVEDMELCGGMKREGAPAPAPEKYDDLPADFNL